MKLADLITDPSGTTVRVEHDGESSQALLFDRDELDEEYQENLEIWMETAEDEEADDDLVLYGMHPIGDDTQVDRLFYYRKSTGPDGPVYALDIDGTAVPGTLDEWADSPKCFRPLS